MAALDADRYLERIDVREPLSGRAVAALMRTRTLSSIDEVPASRVECAGADAAPFLRHEFLAALEHQHCVGPGTGWTPRIVAIEDYDGVLLGAAPCYEKTHSRGEFVFDFSWARAYQQTGLPYYPKLVVGVPFSPVTGERLLARANARRRRRSQALVDALKALAEERGCSSCTCSFRPPTEQ